MSLLFLLLTILELGSERLAFLFPLEPRLAHRLEFVLQVVDMGDPIGFGHARLGTKLVERGFGLLELRTESANGAVLYSRRC